jgi:hypothetical protein
MVELVEDRRGSASIPWGNGRTVPPTNENLDFGTERRKESRHKIVLYVIRVVE